MASIEESKALAPRDALSSTLLTVINNEETLATMSWNEDKSPCKNACKHSQQHLSYKATVLKVGVATQFWVAKIIMGSRPRPSRWLSQISGQTT